MLTSICYLATLVLAQSASNSSLTTHQHHTTALVSTTSRSTSSSSANNPQTSNQGSWVFQPGQSPEEPSSDLFYRVNTTELPSYPLGSIVKWRYVGPSGYDVQRAYQVVYRSEDNDQHPSSAVMTVLLPTRKRGNQVVSYQMSEDSVSENCSPSYSLLTQGTNQIVSTLLSNGFVVLLPDHLGPKSAYTVGEISGRNVLDGLKALSRLSRLRSDVGQGPWQLALYGSGSGGYATEFAAELAAEYAPELNITSAAVQAIMPNLQNWFNSVNESPLSGYAVTSLLGMSNAYPELGSSLQKALVSDVRRNLFLSAEDVCGSAGLLRFLGQNVFTYFSNSQNLFQTIPSMNQTYSANSLGQHAPKFPLMIGHGENDQTVPVGDIDQFVDNYCHQGVPVVYRRYGSMGHSPSNQAVQDAIKFISDSFSGVHQQTCAMDGMGNDVPPPPSSGL